jgi:hypothetical protein
VLIFCSGDLALQVPFLAPLLHLLDLLFLGDNDVLCELLSPQVLALLGSDLCHLYGALVMRNHRVYKALVGVFAILHDHLARGHTHRAVVHPGHTVAGTLRRFSFAAGSATLLAIAGAPSGHQHEGDHQEQREQPRLTQKYLQDNSLFSCGVRIGPLLPY